MGKVNNDVIIDNENLFRTLFCAPITILLVLFAESFLMSSGLLLFKVIYVLMALFFFISTLAYGAYYTNELSAGETESFLKNKNLSKAVMSTPLAVLFGYFSMSSIMSSAHAFFSVTFILLALYFTLCALGYAAFYTNDRDNVTSVKA